jgi:ABC-2 type transport system ATP-binding protein
VIEGTESAVVIRSLKKNYGPVKAVDEISLEVERGEIFGLLGPNGAGKTTTIECLEGLRIPDGGELTVLDLDPQQDGRELQERIGIQFQSAALPARLRVWEILDLFAAFYKKGLPWEPFLEVLGLEEKRNAFYENLSGGQKQRVSIALALINDPELVFLDELTTGLDPQSRRVMWDLVREIRHKGKTVFMTTHFMEEAERLCDRVGIIDQGKLIALDSPGNLIKALGADHRVIFETDQEIDHSQFKQLPGVSRVEQIGDEIVVYGKKEGLLVNITTVLDAQGAAFENLRQDKPTLEDVFLSLTGKKIRN